MESNINVIIVTIINKHVKTQHGIVSIVIYTFATMEEVMTAFYFTTNNMYIYEVETLLDYHIIHYTYHIHNILTYTNFLE